MRLFYNEFENNYEEFLTYYPRFYRDVLEMDALLQAYGRIADELEANIEKVFLDGFLVTADMETISSWERILGIVPPEEYTDEQRRSIVLARVSERGHFGEPEIRRILEHYTMSPYVIDFTEGVVTVTVDGSIFDEESLSDKLRHQIPAHLQIDVHALNKRTFQHDNRYSVGGYLMAKVTPGLIEEEEE